MITDHDNFQSERFYNIFQYETASLMPLIDGKQMSKPPLSTNALLWHIQNQSAIYPFNQNNL